MKAFPRIRLWESSLVPKHIKEGSVRMYENQASLITKEITKEISGTYLKPLVGDYHREMGLPVDVVVFAEDEKTCRLKMKRVIKKLRELVQKKHAQ